MSRAYNVLHTKKFVHKQNFVSELIRKVLSPIPRAARAQTQIFKTVFGS